ncbi:hypothetical protein [Halomarina ordinaria]|uniref:Uncharacterized protein n=1 Tax=Halomarina ordinaria TaxID=3033939 RepID=A0ABD5UAJ1_9EURY|nr:hypothetical protein [Halomarina sp. PSRA2]
MQDTERKYNALADDEPYVVIDVVIGGDIVQKRFNAVGGCQVLYNRIRAYCRITTVDLNVNAEVVITGL